jgi:uncharacterized membrane protein (GlpM family)
MQFFLKLLAANVILIICAWTGRRSPTLAGLVATMPLTSLIVMVWLYMDNPGDYKLMTEYCEGVLWGIIPTVLFFAVTFICFRRHLPLSLVLAVAFTVWLSGAIVHQYLLR